MADEKKAKTIKVTYEKTIEPVTIDYVCERCGKDVSIISYPTNTPKYCDDCRPEATNEKAKARMKRWRENPDNIETERKRNAERMRRNRAGKKVHKDQLSLFDD